MLFIAVQGIYIFSGHSRLTSLVEYLTNSSLTIKSHPIWLILVFRALGQWSARKAVGPLKFVLPHVNRNIRRKHTSTSVQDFTRV